MISYPPTTLLPSPLYLTIDDIITMLCDVCLEMHDSKSLSEREKQQYFDVTMHLVEFWGKEESDHDVYEG